MQNDFDLYLVQTPWDHIMAEWAFWPDFGKKVFRNIVKEAMLETWHKISLECANMILQV